MEKHVLIENTLVDPIAIVEANQALAEATKDNITTLSHTIQTQDMEIVRINMDLEQYRKQVMTPIINILRFDNFLACA